MIALNPQQNKLIRHWSPIIISGVVSWLLFVLFGQTPLIRATGLALVIIGVSLSLRRMGAILSLIGGLTLALCTAFWSQTGGGDAGPATIVIAVAIAGIIAIFFTLLAKRPFIGIGLGILIFVGIFWSQIGTSQSLRLTSLVTAWLTYLLIDMLLRTNPRPDGASGSTERQDLHHYHVFGVVLLLGVGVLNDPLLTLLFPATILSLLLTRNKFVPWYWFIIGILLLIGIWGLWDIYIDTPRQLIIFNGWRLANRWVDLIMLVTQQFSVFGVFMGILGLARLSRWYPPLGTVTMTAYAAYILFGLIYIGPNRETLLLPLLIVQVVWMTYAVFAIGQWAAKSIQRYGIMIQRMVFLLYLMLPVAMLLRIIGIVKAF